MITTVDDNRSFTRMDVDCGVRFKMDGSSDLMYGTVHNLSAQGVSFATNEPLPQDAELFIEVNSGGGSVPPLMANALVLRCTEAANGEFEVACSMQISA
ncbi:MAG: PilZ domain-containing protein [Psychrobium sp.]